MRRIFGMMPSNEVTIQKNYRDNKGQLIIIQAGINGWSVIWSDGSVNGNDVLSTADENFLRAYDYVIKCGFKIKAED